MEDWFGWGSKHIDRSEIVGLRKEDSPIEEDLIEQDQERTLHQNQLCYIVAFQGTKQICNSILIRYRFLHKSKPSSTFYL